MTVVVICALAFCGPPHGGHAHIVQPRGGHAIAELPVESGERLAGARGWHGGEWRCLWRLWDRESHWKVKADNQHSSAYGIPQALPGSKMGTGWIDDAVVQIRWGLNYIRDRYGSPCAALAHSDAYGYY